MDIYLMDGNAFVKLNGSNYMICIGTKEEVDQATPQEFVEMIGRALAICRFRSIEVKDNAVH